jgi:hypothetical protein
MRGKALFAEGCGEVVEDGGYRLIRDGKWVQASLRDALEILAACPALKRRAIFGRPYRARVPLSNCRSSHIR